MFRVALFAINWFAFSWFERHFTVLFAIRAYCFMLFYWASIKVVPSKSAPIAAKTSIISTELIHLLTSWNLFNMSSLLHDWHLYKLYGLPTDFLPCGKFLRFINFACAPHIQEINLAIGSLLRNLWLFMLFDKIKM